MIAPTLEIRSEVSAEEASAVRQATTPEELVELFSGLIWKFASSQLRHQQDAEDVMMETFVAACSNFRKVAALPDQRIWLLAVARRKIVDTFRKQSRRRETDLSEANNWFCPPEVDGITKLALEKLPEEQRLVLVLKYVNGFSTVEVAKAIDKSEAATNSILQRARKNLRQSLDDFSGVER